MVIINPETTRISNPPTVPTTADVTVDIDVGVVDSSVFVAVVVPFPVISVFVVCVVGCTEVHKEI